MVVVILPATKDKLIQRRLVFDEKYETPWGTTIVPHGFITDFGSVPKFLWSFIPPVGYEKSAVLHDYLYRTQIYSRKVTEDIFLYQLKKEKCLSTLKKYSIYYGAKIFGFSAWSKYRRMNSAPISPTN